MCASTPALRPLVGRLLVRRKEFADTFKDSIRRSGSTTIADTLDDTKWSSYDTYCKDVDVEGIGVDGLGYTVTITAGPNLEKRRSNRLQRGSQLPEAEQFAEENFALEPPKSAFLKRISFRRCSSWGSWGLGARSSVVTRPHMEITTHKTLEVVEERVREPDRPMSVSSFYEDEVESRHRTWGLPVPPNVRSFYIESDVED
jgi:hypothetical protein